jgi:hypothetical protein
MNGEESCYVLECTISCQVPMRRIFNGASNDNAKDGLNGVGRRGGCYRWTLRRVEKDFSGHFHLGIIA